MRHAEMQFYPFQIPRAPKPVSDASSLLPTPYEVAVAKVAQAIERAQVTAATGLVIDDDGHFAVLLGRAITDVVYGRSR